MDVKAYWSDDNTQIIEDTVQNGNKRFKFVRYIENNDMHLEISNKDGVKTTRIFNKKA